MAFVRKVGGSYQVRQGNNNMLLSSFSGKGAQGKANSEVARLHKRNKPKSSNRGKSAAKQFTKKKK